MEQFQAMVNAKVTEACQQKLISSEDRAEILQNFDIQAETVQELLNKSEGQLIVTGRKRETKAEQKKDEKAKRFEAQLLKESQAVDSVV